MFSARAHFPAQRLTLTSKTIARHAIFNFHLNFSHFEAKFLLNKRSEWCHYCYIISLRGRNSAHRMRISEQFRWGLEVYEFHVCLPLTALSREPKSEIVNLWVVSHTLLPLQRFLWKCKSFQTCFCLENVENSCLTRSMSDRSVSFTKVTVDSRTTSLINHLSL